jgi:hypothetical protein
MQPTHIVVDTQDGFVFSKDADGVLFTESIAWSFANKRNLERKAEFRTYQVFELVSKGTIDALNDQINDIIDQIRGK